MCTDHLWFVVWVPGSTPGMGALSCHSVIIHYAATHSCSSMAQFEKDIDSVHKVQSTNLTALQELC